MNRKDMQIIANLRQDARRKLTRISRATGIPVSTIFDRIKSYEHGLIGKYTAILDFSMLGFNTRAKVILKSRKNKRQELKDYLLKNINVNTLCKINNGFDFMADLVFRNIKELEDLLELLEERFDIKSPQVYYIIEDIKREEFMSGEESLKLVAS